MNLLQTRNVYCRRPRSAIVMSRTEVVSIRHSSASNNEDGLDATTVHKTSVYVLPLGWGVYAHAALVPTPDLGAGAEQMIPCPEVSCPGHPRT
jgi:hypothetical protein